MDKKALYHVEVFQIGEYEATKLWFIVEANTRFQAMNIVRTGRDLGERHANAARQVSPRKAASLIAEGATDLRVQ